MTRLPSEPTLSFVPDRQRGPAHDRSAVSIQRKLTIASDGVILEKHNGRNRAVNNGAKSHAQIHKCAVRVYLICEFSQW